MGSVLIVGPSEAMHDEAIDAALGVLGSAAHLLEERAIALVGEWVATEPQQRRRANADAALRAAVIPSSIAK